MAIHVILKGKIQEQGPIAHAQVGRSSSVALTLVNFLQAFLVVFNQKYMYIGTYVYVGLSVYMLMSASYLSMFLSMYGCMRIWIL